MNDFMPEFLNKLRFIFVGFLIIAGLLLLPFMLSSIGDNIALAKGTEASNTTRRVSEEADSPNVVTNSMLMMVNELSQTMGSASSTISSAAQSATSAITESGKTVGTGIQTGAITAAQGVGNGIAFVGNTVGSSAAFVLEIPSNVVGYVSNTAVVNSVIRPSDRVEVPIIDPHSPELLAALSALPPTKIASGTAPQSNSGPVWPIHGRITTEFGVPHWPYQRTHSGIDISDSQPSGVTPVRPFRPGRVIDTVRSNRGLGNHVIVDHGNAVTSVYAHLASISVQAGQEVALDTTLGSEGTTGASTGTHLHFEIRVNGQAADPRQFIGGQP